MKCPSREVFSKFEESTNPQWGKPPSQRSTEEYIKYSLVILDKPRGPSSHEVAAWVKKILGVERAGHAGTLDPKVSGVLPIAIAEGTKVLMALSRSDKVYVAVAKFHGDVDEDKLRAVLQEFQGVIYQKPPLRSAVKRQLRTRRVYSLDLLELDGRYAVIKMHVEAGTYARKIIHDIGEVLGVGANMRELRRIAVSCYTEDEAVTLQDIADAYYIWKHYGDDTYLRRVLLPIEEIARHLPKIWVRDSAVDAICNGAPLAAPGISKFETPFSKGDLVAMFTLKGELIGIGRALVGSEEVKKMERGLVARTDRVVMRRGTYPAMWKRKAKSQSDSA
ncbi:RNA-guided pseudouridylation complex pseudouridine synthase subunit Cbf5 [Pyrobaculum aerophilum]|uniref:Probable tRNA pseudouridine synthase B n=2 Tax=Pyrobaculum aerophilum TaxID=13773 RepID=TRUB_PYRAE|nr:MULTISPECIES: RNA-guided pseudouridylation complex pseudouridine synthase subunit Cbf5 [Pyrobaculum]Q8ZYB3.1 RecName: Full=Probable tRNA pseudouridine synthase B; AltName: Full=tRNA pseudouridine(55) synthase; Short=Psi55 synthase; AltName: Full=tRNA pseudouridylate synthase; AltName: Full=tRNA-uridine isomerase [Pyrobaculum aerophilum str. IM2]AAL63082.1 tRNA pseudouridine synthase B [Pyrobaculum aerophilum str. IM2]MCX8135549.1 RNA-guided pseudouridylation complex pseudouridine synthase sub